MNPQRLAFKEYYCNPGSETFGNAKQSAIKAGFSGEYADRITTPAQDNQWIQELLRDAKMLSKAEGVLDDCLGMETTRVQSIRDDDDDPIEITAVDPQLVRIKQDTAKFVTSRLNKEKWSDRTEVTGKGGGAIAVAHVTDEDFEQALLTYGSNAGAKNSDPKE